MTSGQGMGIGLVLLGALGCGDGGPSRPVDGGADAAIDAGVDVADSELTIKLYNHFPLVDGDTANADLVAAQDGDGDWIPLTGDHGVYRVVRAADHYGVLVVCHAGDQWFSKVFLKSVAQDGLLHTTSSCLVEPAPAKVPVTVQLRGTPASRVNQVTGPTTAAGRSDDGDVTLRLSAAPNELLGYVSDNTGANIAKLVRIPPFTAAAGQTYTVDFATGVDPVSLPLSVTGDPVLGVNAGVSTATGEYTFPSVAGAATYQTLPAALRRAGDRHVISVIGAHGAARIEQVTPAAASVVLLPELTGVTVAVTPGPAAPRPTWTVPVLPAVRDHARVIMNATTASGGESRRWQVFLSRGRAAATTSVTYQLPDFAALVTGFPAEAALRPALPVNWAVSVDDITTQPDSSFVSVSAFFSGTVP